MSIPCLQASGSFSVRDRQKFHPFSFTVPQDTVQLEIRFRFTPGSVGPFQNLLTLSLFDPLGFRGAAHRWNVDQRVVLAEQEATPGFFPGPLYPGEWRIEIDAHEIVSDDLPFGDGAHGGCEYELSVAAGGRDEGAIRHDASNGRDPRQSPRGAARRNDTAGWYKGDLHSHNVHCDGDSSAAEMAAAAARRGLDFLATTCHNTTSYFADAGFGSAAVLPLRGMECTTFFGHANALGIDEWIDWRTTQRAFGANQLAEQTHKKGALFVANHPCAVGNPACTGCHWDFAALDWGQVDALEVWNGAWRQEYVYNPAALELWTDLLNQGFRVTATAGTDNHRAEQYADPNLPLIWVYADALGEREILSGLRYGHAFLSSGPELHFVARTPSGFETSLPGALVPPDESVIFDVQVRGLAAPATLWLVSDGALVDAQAFQSSDGMAQLKSPPPSRWCRLELRAGNDLDGELLALTNPLYCASSND